MNRDNIPARFGTFEEWNWSRADIVHVMAELARAHWEDEGERMGGFAAASAGLNIAVIADEGRSADDTVAGILHHVGWLATYLQTTAPTPEQTVALRAIIDATDAWKA